MGVLKDKPFVVNAILLIVVFVHSLAFPATWNALVVANQGSIITIYATAMSAAAIQASFAGVIVVFGLSTQPSAFQRLRVQAGKELVDNWLSISYSGFISSGFSLVALLCVTMGKAKFSTWIFELAVLICAHGIIRLLWLLKQLIKVISNVDLAEVKKQMRVES